MSRWDAGLRIRRSSGGTGPASSHAPVRKIRCQFTECAVRSQQGLSSLQAGEISGHCPQVPDLKLSARRDAHGGRQLRRPPCHTRYRPAPRSPRRRSTAPSTTSSLSALQASPGANAHYRRRREHGDWHNAAQRHLLNRFLGQLHHCLQTPAAHRRTTRLRSTASSICVTRACLTGHFVGACLPSLVISRVIGTHEGE